MLEAQQHKAQETLTQQALQPPMTQTHEEAELRDHQERTSPSGHYALGPHALPQETRSYLPTSLPPHVPPSPRLGPSLPP